MQVCNYINVLGVNVIYTSADDQVYMDNADWRDEYVLNDSGKIYTGNSKQVIYIVYIFSNNRIV